VYEFKRVDPGVDRQATTCRVIVSGGAGLSRWLPDGASFSLDLAFAPLTGPPDQPTPVLVVGAEALRDTEADVRLIGVLRADQTHGGVTARSDCLVAVTTTSKRFAPVQDIGELGVDVLSSLTRAWEAYNASRCATFQVIDIVGAAEAMRQVARGVEGPSGIGPDRRGKDQAGERPSPPPLIF
jgi:hypothetical protein